ncbi:MAG: hypothetical protein FJZ96_10010, partial [Chloroflexi bacterium]|nr:hypothetical protein [Chloroflexota bacterium]
MIKSTIKTTHYLLCLAFLLSACASSGSATTTATAALPTDTPSPTVAIQPTATPLLVTIAATVWTEEPVVPILNLHQFKPDGISPSDKSGHKMQLGDLRASLENLYDAGFSLVSLEDWLSGDLTVPSGRRPLVLTMDDLFYTNQIL